MNRDDLWVACMFAVDEAIECGLWDRAFAAIDAFWGAM